MPRSKKYSCETCKQGGDWETLSEEEADICWICVHQSEWQPKEEIEKIEGKVKDE